MGKKGIYCKNAHRCKLLCGCLCTSIGGWGHYSSEDRRDRGRQLHHVLWGQVKSLVPRQSISVPHNGLSSAGHQTRGSHGLNDAQNSTSHRMISLLPNLYLLSITTGHHENAWSGPRSLAEPCFSSWALFFTYLDSHPVCEKWMRTPICSLNCILLPFCKSYDWQHICKSRQSALCVFRQYHLPVQIITKLISYCN